MGERIANGARNKHDRKLMGARIGIKGQADLRHAGHLRKSQGREKPLNEWKQHLISEQEENSDKRERKINIDQ